MSLIPVYQMDLSIPVRPPSSPPVAQGFNPRDYRGRCQCGHDVNKHRRGECTPCHIKHSRNPTNRQLCTAFKPVVVECKSCGVDRIYKEIDEGGNCRIFMASDRCVDLRERVSTP